VASNVHFTVINLTIAGGNSIGKAGTVGGTGSNGSNKGGAGGNGTAGGNGLGGALLNAGFTIMEDCIVSNNIATGGTGGDGGNGGNASGSNGTGGNGGNGGSGGNGYGGGIYNLGTLLLTNCTLANNAANGGNGGTGGTNGSGTFTSYTGNGGTGAPGAGAGLYNLGTATIVNCTFSQNAAQSGSSAAAGPSQSGGNGLTGPTGPNSTGGGICNLGTETMLNCTFDQNAVTAGNGGDGGPASNLSTGGNGGNGGSGLGGGVYNAGSTGATNCTFANGAATGGIGGAAGSANFPGNAGSDGSDSGANIANGSGTFNLKNSILAYPSNGVCATGTISDLGNNISFDGTPAFSTTNSRNNLDPLLAALDDNGGPALTMALLPGSPAIDAIYDNSAPPFDERGYPRPFGLRSDIGAYEYGSSTNLLVISGVVMAGNMPFPGVTVRAGNSSSTTTSNGTYSFLLSGGANVNYTIYPMPLGYFSPQSTNVPLLSNNVMGLNFMATNAVATVTNNTTNHTIQFTFSVVPTFTYRIQAATNLTSTNTPPTNWVTIASNTAISNLLTFVYTNTNTNFPQRFFRTVTP
jgi:hypothetical protein